MSTVAYAMVSNGSVDASEIERTDAEVVDVMFSWGSTVLEVKHLAAGETLTVGESGCDLLVPRDVLGAASAQILKRDGDKVVIVPPMGATMKMDSWARSEASLKLATGHVAEIAIGEFRIRFSVVAAPKKQPLGLLSGIANNGGLRSVVGSALFHAIAIASIALFMPSLGATDQDDIDRDRIVMLQKMLNVSAQRELEQEQEKADQAGGNTGGDTTKGPQAQGDPGKMGKIEPVPTNGKAGVKGDARPQDATMAREADKQLAASFGLVGILNSASNDPSAPVVPWGTVANGADSKSAMGNMFGSTIDDATGTNGLGLYGTGEGGGGPAQYIGLNGLTGMGRPGNCPAGVKCDGIGGRTGILPGGHVSKGPEMRQPTVSVNGKLDPAVIQRIIQQNSGRFRQCYMMGLTRNPSLAGHVGVKFIIDRTGAVATVADGGSSLPDTAVSQCVVRSFSSLSFPAPDGGMVTVNYGFAFSPGE